MPRNDSTGSYKGSVLNFWFVSIAFHWGWTGWHPHQQWNEASLLTTTPPAQAVSRLFICSILTEMKWHLIVVLVCFSIIMSDNEYFLNVAKWGISNIYICLSLFSTCTHRHKMWVQDNLWVENLIDVSDSFPLSFIHYREQWERTWEMCGLMTKSTGELEVQILIFLSKKSSISKRSLHCSVIVMVLTMATIYRQPKYPTIEELAMKIWC